MSNEVFNMGIDGLRDVQEVLDTLTPRHSQNLMRSTVQAMASEIKKEAKRNAPSDTGDLKKSIGASRDRLKDKNKPTSSVYVTKGKTEKFNGFYWHFLEYGTKNGVKEHAFFRRAIDSINAKREQLIEQLFMAKLTAMIKREQKKREKSE